MNGFHGKGDAPRPVPSGTILFKVRDLARGNASLRDLIFYVPFVYGARWCVLCISHAPRHANAGIKY